jgi:protein-disulfide isomerase
MTHPITRRHLLALSSGAAALAASGLSAQTTEATAEAPAITNYGIGDPAAKVQMLEFLSFTCPHCEHFHRDVYPKLKADYIDTGKVRLEYHEVYFDQLGLLAAMLARCGGEMRYFGTTDMLYDKQMDWAASETLDAAVEGLKTIGRAAGMEDAAMDTCLRDQATAEALVANYQKNIETHWPDDSFGGTPSFIINGTQHSNMSWDELKVIIEAELAK